MNAKNEDTKKENYLYFVLRGSVHHYVQYITLNSERNDQGKRFT